MRRLVTYRALVITYIHVIMNTSGLIRTIALCLSFLVTACVTTPSPDEMKRIAEKNRWELAKWGDRAVPYGDDGEPVVLGFQEGKVLGHSGCNRYVAGVSFGPRPGDVRISQGTTTRMACEPRHMQFETAFIHAFEASTHYRLDGEILSFVSDVAPPLEFYRRPLE